MKLNGRTIFEKKEFGEQMPDYTNSLINEKSPYLLQHAHNPVNWYPWGEEAFRKAKIENKLIFLSIGYSTCHWCHVMERESFENDEVAKVMNDVFVSIKVDREERPDIDGAYMSVSQMMTGTGGWPLNVIMTPDRVPVFALTYIPKESRRGQIGIIELSGQLKELWTEGREEVERRAQEVLSNLHKVTGKKSGNAVNRDTVDKVITQMKESFDDINGGFGRAPKFPSPQNLMFLLRSCSINGDQEALNMAEKTLKSMRMGGIFDHIGFGFHRYSTDAGWLLPHFEKMIYDQAFLIMTYTEAFLATQDTFYRDIVYEIMQFVNRELRSEDGAFYSALDADSENEEGKYYTWRASEIALVLGTEDAELFMQVYNAEKAGNYLDEATGRNTGKNILYLTESIDKVAASLGTDAGSLAEKLEKCRKLLFEYRQERVKPALDDKILTDMNGLMIAALAKAHRAFNDTEFLESAESACRFVINRLYSNGHLLHRYRDGESAINGYLDDYSFFTFGLIELFLSTMNAEYLDMSLKMIKSLNEYFLDDENGAYFTSPSDGEKLPIRMKEGHDGAIPSGNSIQMLNLLRLSLITSGDELRSAGIGIADSFNSDILRGPMYHSFMAIGIQYALTKTFLVRAGSGFSDLNGLKRRLWNTFNPTVETLILDPENRRLLADLEEPAAMESDDRLSRIFVCTGNSCLPPVDSLEEMERLIKIK